MEEVVTTGATRQLHFGSAVDIAPWMTYISVAMERSKYGISTPRLGMHVRPSVVRSRRGLFRIKSRVYLRCRFTVLNF